MVTNVRVAFWNLENLFERNNDPRRPAALARALGRELNGWNAAIRDRKIHQLGEVIRLMFANAGPDLLGVCEVENEVVLRRLARRLNQVLPGRDYQVLGHNSPDARGIDTSFVFDRGVLAASNPDHQSVIKRTATRDLFWATFRVRAEGRVFDAVANHWPSRSAGQYESEPFRMLTGETLSHVIAHDLLDDNRNRPVICMGDFNDAPFNRSMQEYLLGTNDRERVVNARKPMLWNLMWPLMSQEDPGTYHYNSDWNMLDQFLVSRGMALRDGPVRAVAGSAAIFRPAIMLQNNGRPRRFGRPNRGLDRGGYSDHFPITMEIRAA